MLGEEGRCGDAGARRRGGLVDSIGATARKQRPGEHEGSAMRRCGGAAVRRPQTKGSPVVLLLFGDMPPKEKNLPVSVLMVVPAGQFVVYPQHGRSHKHR